MKTTTRKLTARQEAAMARVNKATSRREYLSPDIAKQLARRGLVRLTGNKYQRKEWNRRVVGATLWEVQGI